MVRTSSVLVAALALAATPYSGTVRVATGSEPQGAYAWRAASASRVSLVPLIMAGDAGWCMQTITRLPTATGSTSARRCPEPPTSTGPIFAAYCYAGQEGAFVSVLARPEVAALSIAGGTPVRTVANSTLPHGLRAAVLQSPEYRPGPSFFAHCPVVTPLGASGRAIHRPAKPDIPLAARLPGRIWEHPMHPPRGVCRLTASGLRRGAVAWQGAVATSVKSVPRLIGRAFISCVDTVYVHRGGHYITAAVLLDATHPGRKPPALPGMRPLARHPRVFEASGSEGRMLARRISRAWLVVTEETPRGLAVPFELLEHLRATIRL